MQISHVRVVPVDLDLSLPYRTATLQNDLVRITCVFVRIETRDGMVAWGCAAFDPARTGETAEQVQVWLKCHIAPSSMHKKLNSNWVFQSVHGMSICMK